MFGVDKHHVVGPMHGEFGTLGQLQERSRQYNGFDSPSKQYSEQPRKGIKKANFTQEQAAVLRQWFIMHAENPYINKDSKRMLAQKTGLQERQVANWFTNVRKRVW